MAELWIAPVPACPDHGGPMRHDFAACRWVCRGFDGEGCPFVITDEDLARDGRWQLLGETDGPLPAP